MEQKYTTLHVAKKEEPTINNQTLEACKTELQEIKDKFIRVTADFANFKKRTAKEQVQWIDIGQAQVLNKILPIIDDFDRAIAQARQQKNKEVEAWLEGFELIYKAFYKLLEASQVTEVKTDQEFNPELHEALLSVESDEHDSGTIVQVMQKGFMFKDKVLRPAKVSVAK